MTRIAILGFGLIGGSVALGARARGVASHVTAVDLADVIRRPEAERAADALVDAADDAAVRRALSSADLAVLAGPVRVICEQVGLALEHAAVVTDCGSTKRSVAERARAAPRGGRFVPGHPMAGLPSGGLANAQADLFAGHTWILCPGSADPDALAAVEALVGALDARLVRFTPEEHDAAVARTSHMPQLLASALALVGAAPASRGASGPAFQRATRTAGGAESMWRDIFRTNGDEIAAALRELAAELDPVAAELDRSRGAETALAEALLARARRIRRA